MRQQRTLTGRSQQTKRLRLDDKKCLGNAERTTEPKCGFQTSIDIDEEAMAPECCNHRGYHQMSLAVCRRVWTWTPARRGGGRFAGGKITNAIRRRRSSEVAPGQTNYSSMPTMMFMGRRLWVHCPVG